MNHKLKLTKEKLDLFLFTEYLLYSSYINKELSSQKVSEDFCSLYKLNIKSEEYQKVYELAKGEVEYMESLSIIEIMYSTFEQFLKFSLNLQQYHGSLIKKANNVAKKYNYNLKNNLNYEIVDKYRMINNTIKHGSIDKKLLNQYPKLINKNSDNNEFGTILDSGLNITDDEVAECFSGLYKFAEEMYDYFEYLGYIS